MENSSMEGWIEFDRAMCRKMGRALDGGMSRKID